MKEIGGYFELEHTNIKLNIHAHATKLNTARNCLEYILLVNNYTSIYVPYYTCDVVLEPIIKNNIRYIFYHINKNLEPVLLPELQENEAFLYTNYFGLKSNFVKKIRNEVANLIVDNSQALFAPNLPGTDTFYSLRKFVGTPDGAFLYCNRKLPFAPEAATSFDRVSHLYKRKDINAGFGYNDFKRNDQALAGLPIMAMSASTDRFISTYDFEKNKIIRERNFLYLHNKLQTINLLKFDTENLHGPLCYPLLVANKGLRENLIKNKIFVPVYWPNVRAWIKDRACFEKDLIDSLICLPIDQRYTPEDLNLVLKLII